MKKHAMMCVALWGTLVSAAFSQEEVIIKALVDGPSELIVTTNGFQWKNGMNAKPGKHEGRNEPTFINETAWYPDWGVNDIERGVDTSETKSFAEFLRETGLPTYQAHEKGEVCELSV